MYNRIAGNYLCGVLTNCLFAITVRKAVLLLFLSSIAGSMFAQTVQRNKEISGSKNYADTNVILPISYPPLTEREGKGMNLPEPPPLHPRLYFTAKDIPALKEKLSNHLMEKCRSRIEQSSAYQTNGYLPLSDATHNNNMVVRDAIEARALLYVLFQNEGLGREAVTALLNYYATLKINPNLPDVTREIGRAIVTGSIVYDWCYPLLTPGQKTTLIGRMETLATTMEIEWPHMKGSSILGHTAEAQLSRDLLSLGVAAYDENPMIYKRVAGRIVSEFVPARQFFYPAGYHHQGSAYGAYRFNWDLWAAFIFDRMGYPKVFGAAQNKIPYYFIYSRRPDGQLMRDGDDYTEQFSPFGAWWKIGSGMLLNGGSYAKDPIVLNEAMKERSPGDAPDYLFDFLFFDAAAYNPAATKATLPLTKYFDMPLGEMIARTGWQDGLSSSDVVATMKIQGYNFSNHQHLDGGAFQLYYKGPLTVQSGIYQGKTGSYGGEHFKNYSQRTIAHNTMLVYDPTEEFNWLGQHIINDGGQQYPNAAHEAVNMQELLSQGYQTGEVLAHHFGPDSIQPDYTYLKGELAKAYGKKVKSFQRSFVFLNLKDAAIPAALIVFDKVDVSDSGFKKTWLLHCVEEPEVNGYNTYIRRTEKGYSGRLVNTTLLPLSNNLDIKKIGGKGAEFMVQNRNFPQAIVAADNSGDSAVWRIEVSPRKPSFSDHFLNVMQVMDNTALVKPMVAEKIDAGPFTGAKISDRIVLFSKSGASIRNPFTLTISDRGDTKVLITDVEKGQWKIARTDKKKIPPIMILNTEQLIYFTATKGTYRLAAQ